MSVRTVYIMRFKHDVINVVNCVLTLCNMFFSHYEHGEPTKLRNYYVPKHFICILWHRFNK